ncbi:MAG: PepSY-associated TM helix domain-containing protein [Burkholderiaceae bacterium]
MSAPLSPRKDGPPASRAGLVAWLRKTHGWIGLWGATLGLLFGISGIWLNHRSVLPLQAAQQRSNFQIALPDPGPVDAQTMAAWLQVTLSIRQQATSVRVEPAKPAAWLERPDRGGQGGEHRNGGHAAPGAQGGDAERTRSRSREPSRAAEPAAASASAGMRAPEPSAPAPAVPMQPEHWTIAFGGPQTLVQADYWVGNHSVGIRRTENGVVATLTNLHKGVGMPVAWILLVDTLAGSLILLSLSGLALWTLTRRKRLVGFAIFSASLAAAAGLALARL